MSSKPGVECITWILRTQATKTKQIFWQTYSSTRTSWLKGGYIQIKVLKTSDFAEFMVRLNEQNVSVFFWRWETSVKTKRIWVNFQLSQAEFCWVLFSEILPCPKTKNTSAKWGFFYMYSQLRNRLPQTSMHPKPAMCQWDQNKMIIKGWTCLHLSPCCNIGYFGKNAHHLMVFWLPKQVFLNIQDHSGELWPQKPTMSRKGRAQGQGFSHFLHHKASV